MKDGVCPRARPTWKTADITTQEPLAFGHLQQILYHAYSMSPTLTPALDIFIGGGGR